MIRSSYLRVYLPRELTSEWMPHRARHTALNVIRAEGRFVWHESMADDAFTIEWNGLSYVCPRFPRLRMLEGVLAFSQMYPGEALIPAHTVRSVASELARLRDDRPQARSHILTSPWHVPLRWFAAFDPDDRALYDAPFGLSIRYRTPLGRAADRVERAVHILGDAGFDDLVIAQVRDLGQWLQQFSENALLELDYSAVATLFSDGDLVLDESVSEVRESLESLAVGDYEQAGSYYTAVATRWASVQALTYVN